MNDIDQSHKSGHRGRKFRGKRLKTVLAKPERPDAPLPERKGDQRIAKVMARAGVTSRRDAEEWIAAGRVTVNGSVISSPALNVTAKDSILIDGKPMQEKERTRLFLFHKPPGLVTTNADERGRATIFGALPDHMPRVVSVGRLDINTEGLLLLTNDGGLARVLELPETGWLRRYRVRAYGSITQDRLDALKNGIEIDGVQYGAIEAKLEREQGSNVWIAFAMREGKNREIRNVLGHLGLKVNRLIRVSYGPFQLGDLPDGAVEEVKTRTLREQIGERLAALAGADFSGPVIEREERPASVRAAATLPPRSGGEGRRESRGDERRGGGTRDSSRPPPPTPPRHSLRERGEGRPQQSRPDFKKEFRRDRDDRRPRPERGEERPQRHGDKRHGGKPEGDLRDPSQRFGARHRDSKRKTWHRPPQKRDDAPREGGKRWPDHGGSERPQRHRGDERKSNYAGGERKPRFGRDDRKPRHDRDERAPRGEGFKPREERGRPFAKGSDHKRFDKDSGRPPFGDRHRGPRRDDPEKQVRQDDKPWTHGDKPRDDRGHRGGPGPDRPRPRGPKRPYHGKRDR